MAGPARRSQRQAIQVVLALLAAMAFVVWWLRPSPTEVAQAPGAGSAAAEAGAPGTPIALPPLTAPSPTPSVYYPPGMDPRPRPEGVDEPANTPGQNLPPAYPYPPTSQPLVEGVDPSAGHPEDATVDAKSGIHVVFGARKGVVHPPAPIVLDLQVLDAKGTRLPVTHAVARFRADGTTVETGPWYSASFSESGLLYTASYSPLGDEQAALLKGGRHVFVEVRFDAPNGLGPRSYATVVVYNRKPNAYLTGKYSDAKVQGSLVVQAGVHADVAGDYRLIASLYGPDGETAIAYARAVATLPAGDGTMELSFFGKILHDKGIDGPYVLRYLMIFERDTQKGDDWASETVDHAFTTHAYKAKDFSPDPYTAPPEQTAVVTMKDPSQQNKPPPTVTEADRAAKDQGPGKPPAAAMSVTASASAVTPKAVGPVKP